MRKCEKGKMSLMRYCGIGDNSDYAQHLNWHFADHNNGRMYRCMCMPGFRRPDGKHGPLGGKKIKAFGKNIRFKTRFAWRYTGRLLNKEESNTIES